jgi:uncharacterized protein YndB with AHSA1/START domain
MTESIERTMELHADPERVWRAITDPAELSQWFGTEAEIDLRPGGTGYFGWPEEGRYHCVVDIVEPPTRLVWRWGGPVDTPVEEGDSTRVEWTLARRHDGGTTLRLVESGFRRDEERAENDQGWTDELGELFAYLDAEAAKATDTDDIDSGDDPLGLNGPPVSPATA